MCTFVVGIWYPAVNVIPNIQVVIKLMYTHRVLKCILCQMGWTSSRYLGIKFVHAHNSGLRTENLLWHTCKFRNVLYSTVYVSFKVKINKLKNQRIIYVHWEFDNVTRCTMFGPPPRLAPPQLYYRIFYRIYCCCSQSFWRNSIKKSYKIT